MATALGVCFVLLARVIGTRSPWLGLLAMFYFLGLAKVAAPLFSLRMPRALRDVEPDPIGDRTYRRLGVRRFGHFLRRSPFRYLNPAVYLAQQRGFASVRRHAESAEATHFWAAVLFMPYIVHVAFRGLVVEAVLFTAVQVAFNVYPILHLRVVRARLGRVERDVDARRRRSRGGVAR